MDLGKFFIKERRKCCIVYLFRKSREKAVYIIIIFICTQNEQIIQKIDGTVQQMLKIKGD